MAIYKDWLRARLRLREYFRVVMREFRDAIGVASWPKNTSF